MNFTADPAGRDQALVDLFTSTFTAFEGPAEGAVVGGLARDLLAQTPAADIRVHLAEEDGEIAGAAIFTRLAYPEDPHVVFLLSPMAVATRRQRQGLGRALLTHALDALRAEGVDVVVTYGDPDYYRQVGFAPLTEDRVRPPLPLSQPHGWIGQSLTGDRMPALRGPSTCVPALNRRDVW